MTDPKASHAAQTSASPTAAPTGARVVVAMDVAHLDTSAVFYQRLLGFEPVATVRQGLLFEERHLVSARVPGFMLILREAFGKRPIGTQPGTVLRVGFAVTDLRGVVAGLDSSMHWQHPLPDGSGASGSAAFARLTDPDGYIIELFEGAPGSGF